MYPKIGAASDGCRQGLGAWPSGVCMDVWATWGEILKDSWSAWFDQLQSFEGGIAAVLLVLLLVSRPLTHKVEAIMKRWEGVPKKWPILALVVWFGWVVMVTTHERISNAETELEAQREQPSEPALRYSLGGSTNVFSHYPVPFGRWVPITEFRDVTLEWTRDREATVEGLISFSVLGPGEARCRLRLIDIAAGSPVAVTDWIGRPEPELFTERVDVPFIMAVPRGEGRMVYRLEITADIPNGDMVASAEIVFVSVRP